MRLKGIEIRDYPPIKNFSVEDLSDVVVLAGPNGVGKSRILQAIMQTLRGDFGHAAFSLEATCPEEEEAWGGKTVSSTTPDSYRALNTYLQRQQKRGAVRSSILNFEANRVFERINPFQPSFDYTNPLEEFMRWDFTYNPAKGRFDDVINSMLRRVRSLKDEIANEAITRRANGELSMALDFIDPLEAFKKAFSQLLPGKHLAPTDEKTQNLQYIVDGSTGLLSLDALSSGEREVVTIVFDFLLRDPKDSIIFLDEPELHLHPELSYRLLRTLRGVGERNQFIISTHSPDIISASLDHTVIFVSPPSVDPGANQARVLKEDDEMAETLRTLGQSIGVIALGRRAVLIEGERTSLDKQLYGSILGDAINNLILVPIGGQETIAALARSLDTVLSKTIWGVDFFMLCDGDTSAGVRGSSANLEAKSNGHFKLLPRYHVENYFLDETILATCFQKQVEEGHWLRDPIAIRAKLLEFAKENLSRTVILKVSHQVRMAIGNVDVSVGGQAKTVDELKAEILNRVKAETSRVAQGLSESDVGTAIHKEWSRLEASLSSDDDTWKSEIPGKPILNRFANAANIPSDRLKRLYIEVASAKTDTDDPFHELKDIFKHFSA